MSASRRETMLQRCKSIRTSRRRVTAMARHRLRISKWYRQLSDKAAARYERSGSIADLNQAIRLLKQAVTPACFNPYQAKWLADLGNMLHDRYVQSKRIVDINEAIMFTRKAVILTSDPHFKASCLHDLGLALGSRYDRTKVFDDLQRSIRAHRRAAKAIDDSQDRAERLNDLGVQLHNKYRKTAATVDLDEAVAALREATALAGDHPDRVTWLCNLGATLDHQYQVNEAPSKLDEIISVMREVVSLTPQNSAHRIDRLEHLGIRLIDRWEQSAAVTDLEDMIATARSFLRVAESHPRRARWYDNLAAGLTERYHQIGKFSLLEEAVDVTRKAVALTDESDPFKAKFLSNLGSRLGDVYVRTGITSSYQEAIQSLKSAVDMTPNDSPDRIIRMYNLGNRLGYRHIQTGSGTDLDESIEILHHVLGNTSHNYLYHAMWLDNLACKLSDRYEYVGSMQDLEEALQIARQVVRITPVNDPNRAAYLDNLGQQLINHYRRKRDISDLEEAISMTRQSFESTIEGDAKKMTRLNSLSVKLHERSSLIGDNTGMEEATNMVKECIRKCPDDDLGKKELFYNLGAQLGIQFDHFKETDTLEDSIGSLKKAVQLTPVEYPRRATYLIELGLRLMDRYELYEQMDDLEGARSHFKSALKQDTAPLDDRMRAGDELLLNYTYTSSWDEAYEAAKIIIELIPTLTRRSLQGADMQHKLSKISGLAREAAAVTLNHSANPFLALSLLESGRGVLATSLEDKRADISDLRQAFPELAHEFQDLCKELDSFESVQSVTFINNESTSSYPEDMVARRSKADQRLNELIIEIREKPSFGSFLLPPSQQEMCSAARDGPIVIINISVYRSDAIFVLTNGVQHLELPDSLIKEALEKAKDKNLGSPQMLEWLWDAVMQPVLHALGFEHPILDDAKWPRVWWIPTGVLSKFPLHAAGYHKRKCGESVIDRVMSSYSSSIKTIIRGQHIDRTKTPSQMSRKALLVSMEHTPNHVTQLRFADKEVQTVRGLCERAGLSVSTSTCIKGEILSRLPDCRIFHFAGHGYTNSYDPSKSYLALQDWKNNPLTVNDLFKLDLRSSSPFLAYLSACGTGQINDDELRDESIHLISACQIAGFRHVIGTLWEVADEVCVDIARLTYESIRDERMSDESVCLGLHRASRALRDRWLASLDRDHKDSRRGRDIIPIDEGDDDKESGALQWVPYVHYGV